MSLRYRSRSRSPARRRSYRRRVSRHRSPLRWAAARRRSYRRRPSPRRSVRRRSGLRFSADGGKCMAANDKTNWKTVCDAAPGCSSSQGFCEKVESSKATPQSRAEGASRMAKARSAEANARIAKQKEAKLRTILANYAKGASKPVSVVNKALNAAAKAAAEDPKGTINDTQLEAVREAYAAVHGKKLTMAEALGQIATALGRLPKAIPKDFPSSQRLSRSQTTY